MNLKYKVTPTPYLSESLDAELEQQQFHPVLNSHIEPHEYFDLSLLYGSSNLG